MAITWTPITTPLNVAAYSESASASASPSGVSSGSFAIFGGDIING